MLKPWKRQRLALRSSRSSWLLVLMLALGALGLWQLGGGVWLYAKARLAQWLLHSAWEQSLASGQPVRPWSWADTWPVARLQAPRQGQDLLVLSGSSGRVLAFGPGQLDGSAQPATGGNTVLSAHRDTHFAFLRDLAPGDPLQLQTADGRWHSYRVQTLQVVTAQDTQWLADQGDERLTLVTCYPFAALSPGGDLRYLVIARPVARPAAHQPGLAYRF